MSNNYYDDEGLMEIVDYTVVDYVENRTGNDINHANVDKTKAIEQQTPKYVVRMESTFVTERYGPFLLEPDSSFDVLNQIEAGEIVSIELITDNPYAGLYLEMDDFKLKEPNGMTAAELLLKGRAEYSERHFYVEDRRPDGSYVIKYHPRKRDTYSDKIKIQVTNNIQKNPNFRGMSFDFKARQGLPTPFQLGYLGGSSIRVPQLAAINSNDLPNLGNILARELSHDPYNSPIYNDTLRKEPLLLAGASHPYVGMSGKHLMTPVLFQTVGQTPIIKFGLPGVAVTSTTGATTPDTIPFPGHPNTGNNAENLSEQHIIIYASAAENEATSFTVGGNLLEPTIGVGDSIWVRDGENIYYPGKVIARQFYDATTSGFETLDPAVYEDPNDGAILLTVSPGLNFQPKRMAITSQGLAGIGKVGEPDRNILVHEIIVNRKKYKTLQ